MYEEELIGNLKKRNINAVYCSNKEEASQRILEFIPQDASIGFSGSQTLNDIGIIKALKSRGNPVFDPYAEGISRGESLRIRRQATAADFYLASPNAVSRKGEMVFFSAYGNRISGISYAEKVILVCGVNKITATLEEALKRSREYATPLNCKRLNWESACFKDGICRKEICFAPEYKRMCCQILILEAEVNPERVKVVLVGESLGF